MGELHPIFDQFTDTSAGKKAREYFTARGIPNKRVEEFHFTDLSRGLENIGTPNGEMPLANFKADLIINCTQFGEVVSGGHEAISIQPSAIIDAAGINALLCGGLAKSSSKITISENANVRIAIQRGAGSRGALEIEIGKNANVEIIEEQAAGSGLSSNYVVVNIGENAQLRRIMVMNNKGAQDLRASEINLSKNAKLYLFALCFGGDLVRIDTNVNLQGEGAIANLNAAYMLDGTQNDFTTNINHNAPNCECNEIVRGIVNSGGQGVFQGMIRVAKGAQKTIGKMEHRAIMLEEGARINAKPCLEIYADDVECSHANTIGALDDKALFYMQSRGISQPKAKSLLTIAFLEQVFDDIQDEELKADVIARIENKLGEMIK